jgi:hypothetical protein
VPLAIVAKEARPAKPRLKAPPHLLAERLLLIGNTTLCRSLATIHSQGTFLNQLFT